MEASSTITFGAAMFALVLALLSVASAVYSFRKMVKVEPTKEINITLKIDHRIFGFLLALALIYVWGSTSLWSYQRSNQLAFWDGEYQVKGEAGLSSLNNTNFVLHDSNQDCDKVKRLDGKPIAVYVDADGETTCGFSPGHLEGEGVYMIPFRIKDNQVDLYIGQWPYDRIISSSIEGFEHFLES